MGKIRVAVLGDEQEKAQRRRADARRQTKKSKKEKVEGVGLHGGERTVMMEGVELKPEIKKLIEEVETETEEVKSPFGPSLGRGQKSKVEIKKAKTRSKRYREAVKMVDKNKLYPVDEAAALVKKTSTTRFDGSVELHVTLKPETLGEAKNFRGSLRLPFTTGKTVRVAIADDALLASVESGKIDFDVLVAHPSMMIKLAKHAKILGPKGLMPNPKTGTVTENPQKRAKELASGEVNFKNEPDQPLLHLVVGKVSQPEKELMENIQAYLSAISTGKILRATLSSSMGPGIKVAL